MKNLVDLARFLNRLDDEIRDQASFHAEEIAKNIHEELLYATPVDTSKALSNWQVSLGSPKTNEIPAYFLGIGGNTADLSANAAMFPVEELMLIKKLGQSIFITNNISYIIDLNNGSSSQAPAGFVEDSVMVGVSKTPKFKLKV